MRKYKRKLTCHDVIIKHTIQTQRGHCLTYKRRKDAPNERVVDDDEGGEHDINYMAAAGNINPYQGGIPLLYTRSGRGGGQRGGGFFSSLKRFLLPIGKAILPSVVGGFGDLLEGKSFKETAKSRGIAAGKRALGAVTQTFAEDDEGEEDSSSLPPAKKYKRRATPPRASVLAKTSTRTKQHKPTTTWE